jgi:hypothetical protein
VTTTTGRDTDETDDDDTGRGGETGMMMFKVVPGRVGLPVCRYRRHRWSWRRGRKNICDTGPLGRLEPFLNLLGRILLYWGFHVRVLTMAMKTFNGRSARRQHVTLTLAQRRVVVVE